VKGIKSGWNIYIGCNQAQLPCNFYNINGQETVIREDQEKRWLDGLMFEDGTGSTLADDEDDDGDDENEAFQAKLTKPM
jgi:hypothetical protein